MEKASVQIHIRLTQKEKDELSELARCRGYTVSEYVREKIFGRKMVVRFHDQDTAYLKQEKKKGGR